MCFRGNILRYRLMSILQASMNQSKSAADVNSAGMATDIAAIIATAPILVVYPFLQRYFVVGLNVGSIKE